MIRLLVSGRVYQLACWLKNLPVKLGFAGEDAWIKFPKHIIPLMVVDIVVLGSVR